MFVPALRRWLAVSACLAGALVLWATVIEPSSPRLVPRDVAVPGWPASCAGIRVAVLSDIHTGSPHNGADRLRWIVDAVNAAAPDLVLLAGDYVIHGVVGGSFVEPEAIGAELGRLRARFGVSAVLGNHDWWLDADRVRSALQTVGIRMLDNDAVAVGDETCGFWVAGIGDFWEGQPDIAGTLARVTDDRPVIAFTHNPDVFPDVPPRVSLTIAGHTHGGQVSVPFFGPPIVPSDFGRRYANGLVVEDDRVLFVSPGLGTSILPVRFLVPPAVSLLTLTR